MKDKDSIAKFNRKIKQKEAYEKMREMGLEFRPAILPDKWEKADKSFQDFLLNLLLQSYSPGKIKALLQSMKIPYVCFTDRGDKGRPVQ